MANTHRRLRHGILVAAGIAAPIAAALASGSAGSAHAVGAGTITLFEAAKGSTFGFVDNAPKTTRKGRGTPRWATSSPSATSSSTGPEHAASAAPLRSASRRARAASTTRRTSARHLRSPRRHARGRLQHGEPKTQRLAILGGTGEYDGARGTILARSLKAGTEDTITLLP